MEFKLYIENPYCQPLTSKDPEEQLKYNNRRRFALTYFEVQDSTLYCKAEVKTDRFGNVTYLPPRYIARTNNAFDFISDIYRNLQYFRIQKTFKQVAEQYWGITCKDII
jgi:hypothetical protein